MPDTQREFDEANLEAKAEAEAVMANWTAEFLGHRLGGTLAAPAPNSPANPGPQEPAEPGGEPQTVGPTPGGADLGGQLTGAPQGEGASYSAPGGY